MWWLIANTVAASAAGAYSAHQQAIAEQRRQFDMSRDAGIRALDSGSRQRAALTQEMSIARLAAEHRARMEADTAKTLRDAKIGTILLLALFVTVAIGIGQLCGVIPVI